MTMTLTNNAYSISLDNSEWMRNGDYVPTRFAAQQDAGEHKEMQLFSDLLKSHPISSLCLASMLSNHRLNDNPESTVGILTMAGHG